MKVMFDVITPKDRAAFIEDGFDAGILDDRIKVTAEDADGNRAYTYMQQRQVEKLGLDYIRSHLTMEFSTFFGEWFIKVSENDYYNDLQRNPEKVIPLEYIGNENGTGREIYRGLQSGKYYLRENFYPRENVSKWYICGKQRRPDDGTEARPNLIFACNGQMEKVRFDDWNGVAAYSDTFNPLFNPDAKR